MNLSIVTLYSDDVIFLLGGTTKASEGSIFPLRRRGCGCCFCGQPCCSSVRGAAQQGRFPAQLHPCSVRAALQCSEIIWTDQPAGFQAGEPIARGALCIELRGGGD